MSIFPSHPDDLGEDYHDVLATLKEASDSDDLTDWEAAFVDDMLERIEQYGDRTRVSARQMEIIDRIRDKLAGE